MALRLVLPASVLAGLLATGLLVGAAQAREPGGLVTPGGSVGPLRLEASSEDDVRDMYGRPDAIRALDDYNPPTRTLQYRCGSGCQTQYWIDTDSDVLYALGSNSRRFHTRAGTRVGTSLRKAQRLERRKARSQPCVPGIHFISDQLNMILSAGARKISYLSVGRIGTTANSC